MNLSYSRCDVPDKAFLQSCQIVTFSECGTPLKLIRKNNETSTQEALTPKNLKAPRNNKAKSDWSVY